MPITLNANEILGNLTNLCLQVVSFNNFDFENRFNAFARQYTKWGDKIACVNAWIEEGKDYAPDNADFSNPYKASKPIVTETTITTVLKKRYDFRISSQVLRGAFENEYSLQDFVTVLVAQLYAYSECDIYEQIISDLSTDVVGELTGKDIYFDSNLGNVVNSYADIIRVAQEMRLPNEKYGVGYVNGTNQKPKKACITNKTKLILYVTPDVYAKIMTNVNASLFNSSEIALSKWIDRVEVVDLEDVGGETVNAILCTDDFYRYSPRIKEMRVVENGGTMEVNYYWHVWTNMGKTGAGQRAYFNI